MMFIGPELTEFFQLCSAAQNEEDLQNILSNATICMGFEQYALNHHVDLAGPPGDAIVLMNYDPDWVDRAVTLGYHLNDPVHAASEKATFGFRWSEMRKWMPLSKRHEVILDEARSFGLCDGFTVPVHVPGEYRGTCSFGGRQPEMTTDVVACAQFVGLLAFESARRLVRGRGGPPPGIPKLTQRQLDCLPFVASGKSDWVIGQILGLSPATVHQHVGDAMRRYAVGSRTQLAIRALFDSQIAYNAVFRR